MADDTVDVLHEHNGDQCELSLGIDWESGERGYGADADGNRGIDIPGYFCLSEEVPLTCPACGYQFTDEERLAIQASAERDAANREYDPGEPEPEDYEFDPDDHAQLLEGFPDE